LIIFTFRPLPEPSSQFQPLINQNKRTTSDAKKAASRFGIFNPRVLLALTLCSVGSLLAMLSFAATPPVKTTHANAGVPPDSSQDRNGA